MSVLLLTMGPQLSISMVAPDLNIGNPGTIVLRAVGAAGSVTWTLLSSSLPTPEWGGLVSSGATATLNAANVLTPGAFTIRVRAVDSLRQPVEAEFTVRIQSLPIMISGSLPQWTVGDPTSTDLVVSGGSGVYVSAGVSSGHLPSGIGVSLIGSALRVSGVPTTIGNGSVAIFVLDSNGDEGGIFLTWAVSEAYDPYWSNLVSGYHLDGVITDVKGRSPTTLVGDVTWPSGRFGQAISPETPGNGTAAGITAPNIVLGTEDFAIDFWINVHSTTLGGAIISNFQLVPGAAGWQVYLTAGGKLQWYIYLNGGLTSLTSIYDLRGAGFTHIRINRIAGTMRLFVNGVQDSSVADTQNYNQLGLTSICYQEYGSNRYPLDAAIDDLRIYKGTGISAAGFSPPVIPFPDHGP